MVPREFLITNIGLKLDLEVSLHLSSSFLYPNLFFSEMIYDKCQSIVFLNIFLLLKISEKQYFTISSKSLNLPITKKLPIN